MRGPGRTSRPKVLLAMSGGVDSSVAAALLLERGFDVVGVFMRLGSPGEALDTLLPDACPSGGGKTLKIGKQGCCSVGDAADARLVAAHLGIPFYVANFRKDFGRIIDYFVDEYAQGRTPNPCVRCNDWLKFGRLHAYAEQIDAAYVASGHYARLDATGAATRLRRGVDAAKDQSYVLFGVAREQLGRMLLPVGGYTKPEIRALARRHALPVFDKPDSQEICFVPDNDYAGLIERRRPELAAVGDVLDERGAKVGEHRGQHRFTIGQRRGVGVALGHPIYVTRKDPVGNTVTVGTGERLLATGCVAAEPNWLVDPPAGGRWLEVLAQHRYNSAAVPARARVTAAIEAPTPSGRTGAFEVEFETQQRAVTPGQAIVLYDAGDPEVVLGGGWIARTRHDSDGSVT